MKLTNKLTRIGSLTALGIGGIALGIALSVSPVFAHDITDDSPKSEPTEVETPEASKPGDEVEFKGVVEAVNGDLWTIGGVTFKVDASTMLKGAPVLGSFVEVTGDLQSDGTMLARVVSVEDSAGPNSGSDDSFEANDESGNDSFNDQNEDIQGEQEPGDDSHQGISSSDDKGTQSGTESHHKSGSSSSGKHSGGSED